MADSPEAWSEAWLRGQQELLKGWLGATPTPPGEGATSDLAHRFLGLYDQYFGVTRSLWESMQTGQPGGPTAGASGSLAQGFTHGLAAPPPFPPPASPFGAGALPALGLTRERQESWQRLGQLTARVAEAQARLAASWADVIQRALVALGERVRQRAASGSPVDSLKRLYDLWIETAESVYADAVQGAAYVELQAELTNATSQLLIEQRALFERWAREYDLPTRTELDAVHRRLKEVTAELRTLRAHGERPAPRPRRRKGAS